MIEKRFRLKVRSKIQETPDAITLGLEPLDSYPEALPGQYLNLIKTEFGQDKRRAYSFSQNPEKGLQISLKRIPNGLFSNWLYNEAQEGDVLEASKPFGQFTLPAKLPAQLVFIAGGSGITPIISLIETICTQEQGIRMLLLYATPDPEHTLFKSRLDRLAEQYSDQLECRYFYSKKDRKHLNASYFEEAAQQFLGKKAWNKAHYFLCAPLALMRLAAMHARVNDVPDTHIHMEQFTPGQAPKSRPLNPEVRYAIQVSNQHETVHFEAYENETILNAAARQNISLPYNCKTGICFSCLARCTRGEVRLEFSEMNKTEGVGQLINTCIAYPITDEVDLRLE